ncbi:DEAD-box ATP-dependent RNA helicase 21 [Phytophthora cactorum]|uniref:RNA helicase n=1 Tax=Phytophthora cactorum TaxID=29920 RepID=A0A8T1KI74_9STRA|nr:DEAD-box ATP-dependent RNA helicase 21 [Phytophthora cactorum]KAG2825556.1 DEAD-box ATP-dependent RNA helicase 21 [Phytophthora cactorum]KAG2854471.1 DEAD-box ATP-dependent RNA helicase 21 [Phytophthora cactorum]KAG2899522.1 DEAD-box ATP-dependent RNA helicase 21 [Phytophthora cactorum]KAG2912651.1 DEAD-box ATP-dependent RNA helicase 21 [Phytophthora cactorum]
MPDQRKRRRSRSRSRSASKRPGVELDEEQRKEAERIAAIAKRAEERAAERRAKEQEEDPSKTKDAATSERKLPLKIEEASTATEEPPAKPKFRSKAQRQKDALERLEKKRQEMEKQRKETEDARRQFLLRQRSERERDRGSRSNGDRRRNDRAVSSSKDRRGAAGPSSSKDEATPALLDPSESKALQALKDQYLGKTVKKKKVVKASEKFSKVFQFDWEASEDTSADLNPLYAQRMDVNLLYGRGYRAGVDMREQRKKNSFLEELSHKRQKEQQLADETDGSLTSEQIAARQQERERALRSMQARERDRMQEMVSREAKTMGTHWSEKSLDEMKERDWRIFREDFDITLKGGRAPHPLRKWNEADKMLPDAVFKTIKEMGFERPSPIQMQAIPIGLQKRDIIGIAETGSGKTAAFVIPIIAYIYSLPASMVARTGEQGPLALVMAPTRELALQIEQEAIKLCKYTSVGLPDKMNPIKTLSVVGGQSIEDQGFRLREGVEIIIGTPGRLMDCLESHYLVVAVLENMGSLLKSENEEEMEQQLTLANGAQPGQELQHRLRVTTMFSATMPVEVERLAKTFLRHPSIVKIGDEDSGKNKRIEQRVMFMNPGKKRSKLVEVLRDILSAQNVPVPRSRKEKVVDGAKIIVFVNIKKECDSVAKFISSEGFRCTILHGGKTQDQREESLKMFREGYCDMLVATDVAGRGLDIPDVTHVVNFDLPSKIQNYSHRIGRTGRAGKDGVAISFLTDDDEEIMYDLKQYLVSTEMPVPSELANHPSAKAAPGARDEKGNVIARSKRDTVIYAK